MFTVIGDSPLGPGPGRGGAIGSRGCWHRTTDDRGVVPASTTRQPRGGRGDDGEGARRELVTGAARAVRARAAR